MFTGIIEEIGSLQTIQRKGSSLTLTIHANKIFTDIHLGDSIAVNGVCLTVTDFTSHTFSVDVMPETFHDSSLSGLKAGSKVNLERAMAANGRFGGHFVTGHVDGVGTISAKRAEENAVYLDISIPEAGIPFVLEKGSIAIDGTSLTTFFVKGQTITVSLIPHTRGETVLGEKRVGEIVHLEFDMLVKYVHSIITKKNEVTESKSSITTAFLMEKGFM